MNEKREAVRWRVSLPVRYAGLNTPTEGICHTHDVSVSGTQLAMVERHKEGDRLEMIFDFPKDNGGPVCLEGDVVWQKETFNSEEECKYLTGISFRGILDSHKNNFLDYVSANHPQEFRSKWWEGIQ